MATKKSISGLGSRVVRHDGVDKVTGRAQYANDVTQSGTLFGRVLRSPHAHARLLKVDASAALSLPGVKAVVTAVDLPRVKSGVADLGESEGDVSHLSMNVLARDKVLYHGHAIAAVAATSSQIAEEALKAIVVEYELLPPVLDVRAAMAKDAPILLDSLRTLAGGKKGKSKTNVASHAQHAHGDIAAGFKQAAVIIEREFKTAMVHQGYIEPQACTVHWNADGQVTVWCSTQSSFGFRGQLADLLKLPHSHIKVVPTEIGGGFGGKLNVYLEPLAALLSKKSGNKPVKISMSRTDVLLATGPTSGGYVRVKMGANKKGVITAAQAVLEYEAGAFPGSPVGAAMGVILAPYKLANVQIDGYDVLVNKPKTAAYRAPGGTNAAFASESVVDELAAALKMDPIAFRVLNGVKKGDRRADGPTYERIGFLETLEQAQKSSHAKSKLPANTADTQYGRGIASGFWFNWGGKSACSASINPDGSISFVEGSVDIGGTRTSISMHLADVLGVSVSSIKPAVADTDSVGYNDATGGSRTTYGSGWAAHELGLKLKEQMIARAAGIWSVKPSTVSMQDGVIRNHKHKMTVAALAAKMHETGGAIVASVSMNTGGGAPAFATHIVDVAVDRDTGKVQILRYTAVQDAGKAIYPPYVEGQMQGGVSQGVGWALNEEYWYNADGRLVNASLLDYRMPTALDLPMIETIIVEVPSPGHPHGVRGVGEVGIVPPAAAVANAISAAIGVRMTELPMNPGRVLKALGKI